MLKSKNGILVVQFANSLQEQGMSKIAAVLLFVPAIYVLLAKDHRKGKQAQDVDAQASADQPFEAKVAAGA
jgi:hypothetical protein